MLSSNAFGFWCLVFGRCSSSGRAWYRLRSRLLWAHRDSEIWKEELLIVCSYVLHLLFILLKCDVHFWRNFLVFKKIFNYYPFETCRKKLCSKKKWQMFKKSCFLLFSAIKKKVVIKFLWQISLQKITTNKTRLKTLKSAW